jgi:hypothetical protein
MFHLCFPDICCKVCLSGCCICFIYTLHLFYLGVVYGCNGFQVFFQLFQKHVLFTFRRMLQLLYLDVSKTYQVLHLSSSPSTALSRCPPGDSRASIRRRGQVLPNRRRRPLPLLSLGRRGPRVELAKWSAVRGCPTIRPGTSPAASKLANSMYARDFGGLGMTDIII